MGFMGRFDGEEMIEGSMIYGRNLMSELEMRLRRED
jgi:hypothetical protein